MDEEASSKDQSLRLFFPVIRRQKGRLPVQLTTMLAILGKDKKTGLTTKDYESLYSRDPGE